MKRQIAEVRKQKNLQQRTGHCISTGYHIHFDKSSKDEYKYTGLVLMSEGRRGLASAQSKRSAARVVGRNLMEERQNLKARGQMSWLWAEGLIDISGRPIDKSLPGVGHNIVEPPNLHQAVS